MLPIVLLMLMLIGSSNSQVSLDVQTHGYDGSERDYVFHMYVDLATENAAVVIYDPVEIYKEPLMSCVYLSATDDCLCHRFSYTAPHLPECRSLITLSVSEYPESMRSTSSTEYGDMVWENDPWAF